jgi:hypothetical protein
MESKNDPKPRPTMKLSQHTMVELPKPRGNELDRGGTKREKPPPIQPKVPERKEKPLLMKQGSERTSPLAKRPPMMDRTHTVHQTESRTVPLTVQIKPRTAHSDPNTPNTPLSGLTPSKLESSWLSMKEPSPTRTKTVRTTKELKTIESESNSLDSLHPYHVEGNHHLVQCFPDPSTGLFLLAPGWDTVGMLW